LTQPWGAPGRQEGMQDPMPAPGPAEISQEDRVLAGIAHLSVFIGFPVVAPLVIYAIKKDQSRFVAYHALQAAITHISVFPLTIVGAVLGGIVSIAGGALLAHASPFAFFGMFGFWYLGAMLPWLLVALVSLWAGFQAFSGNGYRVPIASGIVDRIMAPAAPPRQG
jgi:uncharacterized protein